MIAFSEMRSVAWNTTAEMLGLTLSDVLTGASSAKFLRGDGTWSTPTATSLSLSTSSRLIGRASAGAGMSEELTVSGGIEFTGGLGIQTSAFTGDVTKASGGTVLTLASVVSANTNTKITYNAKGLVTAGSQASASDLSNGTTGSGSIVLAGSPVLTTPDLGTPSALVGTNITGTAASFNVGTAATWTTARNLAGNSVNGSANVAFANKFIVQGTADTGLSAAQFLGALGTGIVKNTTTTGVLSIAVAGDFPTLNQNTSGTAAGLSVVLVPASGGTGIANNNASTLTISGNFATTLTVSGITGVTLPTSGTLATLAGSEEFTNKTLNASVGKGTWTASGTWTLPALTLGGAITYGGVTLSNAVVGTGSMVLSSSPTITTPTISGNLTGTGQTNIFSGAFSGGIAELKMINTSNTASSDARVVISAGGSSAGNAYTIYDISGVVDWFEGVYNNSGVTTYTIGTAAFGGSSDFFKISTAGLVTVKNTLAVGGAVTKLGNITTSGVVGAPAIVATGRSVAATAAVTSVSAFTVGGSDASFEVSCNVNVTTATTHNFTATCAYTDETNTARTLTFGFVQLTGSTFITAITNLTGTGPYESPLFHIRCKASTTITIATTGTFTLVVYNVEGLITQYA